MELLAGVLILLVLTDLLLTFGVIRRLREHAEKLTGLQESMVGPSPTAPRPGSAIADFPPALATDGNTVSPAELRSGTRLVAFYSVGCGSCEKDVLPLTDRLRGVKGSGVSAFVIVEVPDDSEQSGAHVARLTDSIGAMGSVVREPFHGPVQEAFDVNVFPTYVVVEGGVVAQVTHRAADVRFMESVRKPD
jgi:hypothetical protein